MEKITSIRGINTGDALLVSSKSWLARQIQKFQKTQDPEGGKWNHAAMFWWAYDELFVIEADKFGIACTPYSEYVFSNRDLLVIKPKFKVDGSEYGKFMLPYVGHTRYDKWNLVVAQAVKMLTFGKLWLGHDKTNTKKFICGEWVAFVYNHFECTVFPNWNRTAPVDIYEHPYFTKYPFEKELN
jgi:hypothetical protein